MQLLGVVAISTTALIPQQRAIALRVEILGIGCLLCSVQIVLQVQYLTSETGHPRHWGIVRIVKTPFANVPFIVVGMPGCC